MKLSPNQKLIIEQVVNVFETGRKVGDYAAIAILRDGPNKCPQITYGRSQTTEFGNLEKLLNLYIDKGGLYAKDFEPYIAQLNLVSLVEDAKFLQLLRDAGTTDAIMCEVQDTFFDKYYFQPAVKWAEDHGFALPLSALVIYDSFIHSGGIPDFLRKRFNGRPPSMGGDEKTWITQYVATRDAWLANHSNKVLRPTVYRTRFLRGEVSRNNWALSMAPLIAHGVRIL